MKITNGPKIVAIIFFTQPFSVTAETQLKFEKIENEKKNMESKILFKVRLLLKKLNVLRVIQKLEDCAK